MFELEDDRYSSTKRRKLDDYDYALGIALSKSILEARGSQILAPEEIQMIVDSKLSML